MGSTSSPDASIPPPPSEAVPRSSCPVCSIYPGRTCNQIALLSPHVSPVEVCRQLENLYDCDCSGCECMRPLPMPPPAPNDNWVRVWSPPPGPSSPPGDDPVQIFALALLVFVSLAFCGSLCLVASCLLGWLDQGALDSHAAPPASTRSLPCPQHTPRAHGARRTPPAHAAEATRALLTRRANNARRARRTRCAAYSARARPPAPQPAPAVSLARDAFRSNGLLWQVSFGRSPPYS